MGGRGTASTSIARSGGTGAYRRSHERYAEQQYRRTGSTTHYDAVENRTYRRLADGTWSSTSGYRS